MIFLGQIAPEIMANLPLNRYTGGVNLLCTHITVIELLLTPFLTYCCILVPFKMCACKCLLRKGSQGNLCQEGCPVRGFRAQES